LSLKHKTGSEDGHELRTHEVFWPLDLLPTDCSSARILTWGYDSKVSHYFSGPASQSNITAHARNLLAALRICRLGSVGSWNCVYGIFAKASNSNRGASYSLHILWAVSNPHKPCKVDVVADK
jgi:hypothetical protein